MSPRQLTLLDIAAPDIAHIRYIVRTDPYTPGQRRRESLGRLYRRVRLAHGSIVYRRPRTRPQTGAAPGPHGGCRDAVIASQHLNPGTNAVMDFL